MNATVSQIELELNQKIESLLNTGRDDLSLYADCVVIRENEQTDARGHYWADQGKSESRSKHLLVCRIGGTVDAGKLAKALERISEDAGMGGDRDCRIECRLRVLSHGVRVKNWRTFETNFSTLARIRSGRFEITG